MSLFDDILRDDEDTVTAMNEKTRKKQEEINKKRIEDNFKKIDEVLKENTHESFVLDSCSQIEEEIDKERHKKISEKISEIGNDLLKDRERRLKEVELKTWESLYPDLHLYLRDEEIWVELGCISMPIKEWQKKKLKEMEELPVAGIDEELPEDWTEVEMDVPRIRSEHKIYMDRNNLEKRDKEIIIKGDFSRPNEPSIKGRIYPPMEIKVENFGKNPDGIRKSWMGGENLKHLMHTVFEPTQEMLEKKIAEEKWKRRLKQLGDRIRETEEDAKNTEENIKALEFLIEKHNLKTENFRSNLDKPNKSQTPKSDLEKYWNDEKEIPVPLSKQIDAKPKYLKNDEYIITTKGVRITTQATNRARVIIADRGEYFEIIKNSMGGFGKYYKDIQSDIESMCIECNIKYEDFMRRYHFIKCMGIKLED